MEIGILMAAGMGTRMRPLTLTKAKPLVEVKGMAMIETVIQGLLHRGVSKIYVVVGYLGEQFAHLPKKYPCLEIVDNKDYEKMNNISSVYAVRRHMGEGDCFICEADLYLSDATLFDRELNASGYFGKMVAGPTTDWVFDLEDGRITRVGKVGHDQYNMVGLSYFRQEDALRVAQAVEAAYEQGGHEQLFWDEIVDQLLPQMPLCVYPVGPEQIVEIDTLEELQEIDSSYR